MHRTITGNVTGATSTMAVFVERTAVRNRSITETYHTVLPNLLNSVEDNRVFAHAEVVISTPYGDFLLDSASVSDREFGRKAVDIVEVPVALVLVLLLELFSVE